MSEKTVKVCINCRFLVRSSLDKHQGSARSYYRCGNPQCVSLVTGETQRAEDMRKRTGLCGIDGALYEPKVGAGDTA